MNNNYEYIRITQVFNRYQAIHIASKSSFFASSLIIKLDENKMTFEKPTIDYRGKLFNPCMGKSGFYQISMSGNAPYGKYYFDEDSNEDIKICYFD